MSGEKKVFIKNGLGRIESDDVQNLWESFSKSKWIKKTPAYFSKSLIFFFARDYQICLIWPDGNRLLKMMPLS